MATPTAVNQLQYQPQQYQPQPYQPQPYQPQQYYQPQYYPQYQPQYQPPYQPQYSSPNKGFFSTRWKVILLKITVLLIIILLIYNFACELPVIGMLCTLIGWVWKLVKLLFAGLSFIFGLF